MRTVWFCCASVITDVDDRCDDGDDAEDDDHGIADANNDDEAAAAGFDERSRVDTDDGLLAIIYNITGKREDIMMMGNTNEQITEAQ